MVPSTVKNVRNIIIAKGICAQYNTSGPPSVYERACTPFCCEGSKLGKFVFSRIQDMSREYK